MTVKVRTEDLVPFPIPNPDAPVYGSSGHHYFRTNKDGGDTVGCCWCGHLIKGLKWDSLQMKTVNKFCSDCGKLNLIEFHWSLIIEATPIKEAP